MAVALLEAILSSSTKVTPEIVPSLNDEPSIAPNLTPPAVPDITESVSVASGINVNTPVLSSNPKNPVLAPLLLYRNLIPLSKLSSEPLAPIWKIGSAIVTTVEFVIVCVPVTVKLPLIVTVSAVTSSERKLTVTVNLFQTVT